MESAADATSRRSGCEPTGHGRPSTTYCMGRSRPRSMTSCCGVMTVSRPTTWRSSSTMFSRGSTRWCVARTCCPQQPPRPISPNSSATAPPSYAHVPLAVNVEGRRLAKRDGAVTLARAGCLRHDTGRRAECDRAVTRAGSAGRAGLPRRHARALRSWSAAPRAMGGRSLRRSKVRHVIIWADGTVTGLRASGGEPWS